MDDTNQTKDELVDGPLSPRTDVSFKGGTAGPSQPTTKGAAHFAEAHPKDRAPDTPPNQAPDAVR